MGLSDPAARKWAAGALAGLCAVALASGDARAQSADGGGATRRALLDAVDVGGVEGERAQLEADQIEYDSANDVLRATGNVEIFYAGRILRADEVVYDAKNDQIDASGRIELVNTDGSVVAADAAAFDSELRNGLIRGARATLGDGQTRLAAVEGRRVDGRFTTLSKAVYSPCATCEDNPTPLWRIRARRVTQDEAARDIIYEDATFEVLGVPIGYLPAFRHADPTVKRRTGFLTPSFDSTSELGYTMKTPYYIEIANNRDLTITPFIITDDNPALELEYRAIETYGEYELSGSYTWSNDSLDRGSRGHFLGDGRFAGPLGFEYGFDALYASDDTYLRRYEYSTVDRAEINVYTRRFWEDGFAFIGGSRLQSFRADEPAGSLPLILPQIIAEARLDEPVFGGQIGFFTDSVYLRRTSGRDVGRLSADLYWRKVAASQSGLVLDLLSAVRGDLYNVQDDPQFGQGDDGLEGRITPTAAATLSYPLGRATERAFHLIEPTVQFVLSPYSGNNANTPNEDSQDAELDDLNIFALNRFPGRDRLEDGPRAVAGLRYQRLSTNGGPDFDATLGQSYRLRENVAFTDPSGLRSRVSDVVGSWRVFQAGSYSIGHRFRLSEKFNFRRNEAFVDVELFERLRLDGSYAFIDADPGAGSDFDRSEIRANAEVDVTKTWEAFGGFRRDIELDRWVSANAGLRYHDECLEVDFTVGRRFNSVADAPESTNFGVRIRLKTLGDQ